MMSNLKKAITRRKALGTMGIGVGLAGLTSKSISAQKGGLQFSHGVASGDPLHDRVILWTRVLDPSVLTQKVIGHWEISTDSGFSNIVATGPFKTGPKQDFTVKVDAHGLRANTRYWYRFITHDITSPTGRTRTLPEGDIDAVDLAVTSCSNYSHGYFHVYREISKGDYQAVLHLGDYIYEYAQGNYDNAAVLKQGRTAQPKTETISLEDYRRRYAHYRTDPDLQAVHAAHPFICVWDDHEVANDTWKNGAENHNENEGDFHARRKAAMQAYFEWLPIRENNATRKGEIYRTFELGTLATLIMLDTRHIGRDRPLDYQKDLPMRTIPFDFTDPEKPTALLTREALDAANPEALKHITVPFLLNKEGATPMTDWPTIKTLDPQKLPAGYSYLPDTERFKSDILGNPERTILGKPQEDWLTKELAASKAKGIPWQILGQQLLSGKLGIPLIGDEDINFDKAKYFSRQQMAFFRMLGQMGLPLNLDAWDGYPQCRERVFQSIKENANNAVFLAGDTHNAWAFDLKDEAGETLGVELATSSISSPGFENYIPADPDVVRKALHEASPELSYANTKNRGWMTLKVTHTEVNAAWHFLSDTTQPEYSVIERQNRTVRAGIKQIGS